ncbi:MAG TPA: FMN-binding protein [Ruminiclostridium sp.]|nr:FMN-binding protein [Ruminiclostridium sp.]
MKQGKKKINFIKILRPVIQILFFILLPALFISTFSGIKQIYLSIIHGTFNSAALVPQLIEAIAIIPVTIIAGRFFCGWMCAFGSMSDSMYFLSNKLFKHKFKISEKADRVLKYAKYVILCLLIIAVWTANVDTFSSSDPWDAFGMLFTFGKIPDFSYVMTSLTPALIILSLIIIASFFADRFFCRYLCPLGAVFSLISKPRIISILKPKTKCGNCRICTDSCPMGIALYNNDSVKSGECINCFNCVAACPRKNVSPAVSEKDVRPVLAGTMAVAVMTGVYYAGSIAVNSFGLTAAAAQSESASTANKKYNDGTYTGTGTGFRNAQTTVSVTVKNDKITAVNVVSYGDDAEFFNRAFPTVVQSIINTQSAQVDAVSGATFSSSGIMSAVADALSQASITQNSSEVNSSSQSETVSSESQKSESISSGTSSADTASSAASQDTNTSSAYKDGTYEGSGQGFRGGTTVVSVTVKNGKITDVTVNSTDDDMPFFNRASSTVIQSIIDKQSTQVDAVSGATFSSNGIMSAVADALSKAK